VRAHDRICKPARSRADLEGHAAIEPEDMLFAIDCRTMDRRAFLAPLGRFSSKQQWRQAGSG